MNIQTPTRSVAVEPDGITLRPPVIHEAREIGALLHAAFSRFQTAHGFASDFASAQEATGFAAAQIDDPLCYSVVAVEGRRIVGVNFLSEGDPIRGVGPIAVAPDMDGRGIGRRLMHAVIERGAGASGVRLLQDTFNLKSLSLYTSLGFRVREPFVVLKGRIHDLPREDRLVRPMMPEDLPAVAALGRDLTGSPRRMDAQRALSEGNSWVVQQGPRVTGYATNPGAWAAGHAMAASEADFQALLCGIDAQSAAPLQFLMPARQARLLRWLLHQGMHAEKQMLLMSRGAWQDPAGIYVPSVLY